MNHAILTLEKELETQVANLSNIESLLEITPNSTEYQSKKEQIKERIQQLGKGIITLYKG